jgi:hypothetical protein
MPKYSGDQLKDMRVYDRPSNTILDGVVACDTDAGTVELADKQLLQIPCYVVHMPTGTMNQVVEEEVPSESWTPKDHADAQKLSEKLNPPKES